MQILNKQKATIKQYISYILFQQTIKKCIHKFAFKNK